jgi:hypothetical protein
MTLINGGHLRLDGWLVAGSALREGACVNRRLLAAAGELGAAGTGMDTGAGGRATVGWRDSSPAGAVRALW